MTHQPDLFSNVPDYVWADHNPNESSDWKEQAFALLCEYVNAHVGETCIVEVIRTYAEGKGLPVPNDKRSWGNITRRAQKSGIMVKTDRVAPSASSHYSGMPVWKLVGTVGSVFG